MMKALCSLKKCAWLATLVLAVQTGASYAQTRPGIRAFVKPPEDCYVTDPIEPENIQSFLRVQILALSLAQRGERANIKMLETKGGAPFSEIDKTIAGLREELIENTCASFVVSYYKGSKNQSMATVAKYLAQAYDGLGKMSDQMLGINLQKNGAFQQRQLSALLQNRQEILRNMTDALNLSLGLLIDDSRVNAEGKPDHLILRSAEKRDLLEYLYTRFPALKGDGQGPAPSGDFIKQAQLIRAFLLTSGYRPADL
jgi:hypothetical protein